MAAGGGAQGGSTSLVLHELGHAVGDLLGLNDDPQLIEHHRRLFPELGPYYTQEGPGGRAGRHELLAEGTAVVLRHGRETAESVYDPAFVTWLYDHLTA